MTYTHSELSTSELAEQKRRDNLCLADALAEDALAAEQSDQCGVCQGCNEGGDCMEAKS